jgi:hypothetical protein
MQHNFQDSLARSHSASDWPGWEGVYRTAFPTFAGMTDHRANGEWQAAGIDRSITLENSKQVLIDEKVRFKDYDDIAIEHTSNDRTGAPGWAVKAIRADYIAYLIAPRGRCYMLPVLQLQAAWARHSETWTQQYRQIRAHNNGYDTISCPLPVVVLMQAIGACLRVEFEPWGDA